VRDSSSARAAADCIAIEAPTPAVGPIVDRSFALGEIAAAQAHLEADRHVGTLVVRI
jgi:NADPH:quinone reductase-like Zn-dependent oxidoreductase